MTMPNFLIISPPRTATTSLYFYLKQHPSIFMSPVKEPGYFILEEGKPLVRPGKIAKNYTYSTLEEYQNLFEGITNETAFGEATTFYFYKPDAARRIHSIIPDVKLVALLRDPVDRAFSDYLLHYGLLEIETVDDFKQALLAELNQPDSFENWWEERRYINAGLYYTHLSRYFEYFDISQIKVLLYDDFKNDSGVVLGEIFDFLDVDRSFVPKTNFRYNSSGVPQNSRLHSFTTKPNRVSNIFRHLLPENVKTKVIGILQNRNYIKPAMDPDVRSFLIDIFRKEILQLEENINLDLSSWLNEDQP